MHVNYIEQQGGCHVALVTEDRSGGDSSGHAGGIARYPNHGDGASRVDGPAGVRLHETFFDSAGGIDAIAEWNSDNPNQMVHFIAKKHTNNGSVDLVAVAYEMVKEIIRLRREVAWAEHKYEEALGR